MVLFTVCCNEHTVKVILNSRNPTDDSVRYNLKEAVSCPTNMVSMACLESATILAPSMFRAKLLSDPSNVCERIIYQAGVQQGNVQDYWNAKNDAANNQGSTDGTNYDQQTNSKSLKTIFTNCTNMGMTVPDNVARFLLEFVLFTRCFKISISPASGDNFTTTTIYWTPIPAVASNTGFVTGTPATLTPLTPTTAFTSTGANPLTYSILSAKLKQLGQYTFTLQLADQTTYTANALQYTSEFRMAGKWLKLFGLDPGMNDVNTTNTPSWQNRSALRWKMGL